MALATRCPYCQTTFRVVEDQLKLHNGIVRCGSCQQIFNGSEQLLEQEDAIPEATNATEKIEEQPVSQEIVQDKVVTREGAPAEFESEEPVEELDEEESFFGEMATERVILGEEEGVGSDLDYSEVAEQDEDLSLVLTPAEDFVSNLNEDDREELSSGLEESDFLSWDSFELKAEEDTSIDLDLGPELIDEPEFEEREIDAELEPDSELTEQEATIVASEIEVERPEDVYEVSLSTSVAHSEQGVAFMPEPEPALVAEAVEPDFMKRVQRQQRYGNLWRNMMLVGILVLPLFLFFQSVSAFHNRIVNSFPAAKPALSKICGFIACKTELPRQIEKIVVEYSELLAVDKNVNRYALNLLLSNRSGMAQAWPNLELTLNDEDGRPVARRVFMPVDYLNNVNEKTQGVEPNSEKLVRLVFELDKLKAAGYLVHVFYI